MIDRYTRPEMGAIWTKENKYRAWLKVEIAVCDALGKLGVIPDWVAGQVEKQAKIDVDRIEYIEHNETRHDLIAFVKGVSEHVGEAAKYLHFGVTSYDIEDPATMLLLRESLDLIIGEAKRLEANILRRAKEHKHTLMIGRTHGIHAEPITLGFKLAVWMTEVQRGIERLQQAREVISYGKISGSVGTYANINPRVEQMVCQKLDLKPAPVSTQILQRDRHAQLLTAMVILSCSLEKFATEVRNLQRTEIREVEEFFHQGQRGSSSMPHKRNPWVSEQVCGIARVMRGYLVPGLENVTTWHERDLSNSSVERIILPDACCLLHYQLFTFANIVDKLIVYPENMRANLDRMGGLVASQQVMHALIEKGLTREEAYKVAQENAMKAWEGGSFRDLLAQDPRVTDKLTPEELKACLAPEFHLKNLDVIFDRL
ncbi:MAG TPA: adenylosuccinate lyase, partial [Armatimonadota bacterium]